MFLSRAILVAILVLGALDGIRTHTVQSLKLLRLPDCATRALFGTADGIRTHTVRLLRPLPLPIALPGH